VIEAAGLTKRYGSTVAVDDLSFTVPPGQVTGFLGPNGAGKSTTMRLILGLDAPDSGSVTVGGRPYAACRRPLFEAGALLEAKAFHGGRSARNHLLCLALSNGISRTRVDEVLDLTGLASAAGRRAGGFSLGMSPPPCWATRQCSYSTNRSTAWTPRVWRGSARCCGRWPPRAGPCCCPVT
jgi:ABC-2 type transport system ATP-binding protein